MKSKNTVIVILVIAIVILVAVLLRGGGSQNVTLQPSPTPIASASTVPSSSKASIPARNTAQTPVHSSTQIAPQNISSNNYVDYVNQLAAAQNACRSLASQQYNAQFSSNLQSSAFTPYLNTSTNMCYMQVTGNIQQAYSATTTSVMYFRNVSRNFPIAECSVVKGPTFSGQWTCVDKLNGQSIGMDQYSALISQYTVH